jgi:hypothetical protein
MFRDCDRLRDMVAIAIAAFRGMIGRMTKPTLLALSALVSAMMAPAAQAYDRQAWQSDYARLKVALAQGYANIDWQVDYRGFNLASADRAISAMLDGANDDTAATLAMVRLVEAFDDPHLQLGPGPAPDTATLVPRASDVAGAQPMSTTCGDEGYGDIRGATRLPYTAAPQWKQVSAAPFQAGMIGDTGIIRIPSFDEKRYRAACIAAARPGMAGRALQLATRAELNRQLIALTRQLRANGMKRLIVDLSRNGGGSEWSSEAITIFAAGQLRRNEPRRVGPTCDRTPIWKGEKPACAIYAADISLESIEASPGENAWDGPMAILADDDTASAAEEFITWARDNGKAVLGGARTHGSGCGYMDGGAAFQFTAVPMHLMMPNCSRFTRNGVNEIEGQAPDLFIDWQQLRPSDVADTLDALFALGNR